jgi:hypothetical protein
MKKIIVLLVSLAFAVAPLAQAADSGSCPNSQKSACCAKCKGSCECKGQCQCKQGDASKACPEKGKCPGKDNGASGNDKKS